MEVDPGQSPAAAGVVAQHLAQRRVAPGRPAAAVEETVGMAVLAARDRLLERALAVLGDEASSAATVAASAGQVAGTSAAAISS